MKPSENLLARPLTNNEGKMYEQNELELEILRGTLMPYTKYWDKWVKDSNCFLEPEEVKAIETFLAYYTGNGEDDEIIRMQLRPHYKRAIQKLQERYMDFLKYLDKTNHC